MKHAAFALALLAAAPAAAQDDTDTLREGFDLFSEGSRMILEGLVDGMRPMLDEAQPFFEEDVLPFLQGLGAVVDDLTLYEMPERLPNGDIIIRRRPDAPAPPPLEGEGDGDGGVEL